MELNINKSKFIDIEEFKDYTKDEKSKILLSRWNIDNNLLQGTIDSIEGNIFKVNNIQTLDGKVVKNIFIDKEFTVIGNVERNNTFKNEIYQGDDVVFEFIPKNMVTNMYHAPINIVDNSIIKIEDIEDFYSEKDFELTDIIASIKSNESIKIKKVLANREFFENNAKEIYSKQAEIITKEATEKNERLKEKNIELEGINDSFNLLIESNTKYLEKINNEINLAKIEKQRLIDLGILKVDNKECEKQEKVDIDKEDYINYIVKYLGSSYKSNLYYNNLTIEKLYAGLCTNQLVILSGSPGTGKTSIVEGFCDAIGAKKKVISVQPNWSETQDLLGFYNPVEKVYVSTPFLDFLIEAKNDKDNLYIVCLDEMNLAHVEYYFAEFLSKLETKDRELELYSEQIYINNIEETDRQRKLIEKKYNIENEEDSFNIEDINIFEKYNNLKSRRKNYLDYNCKLTIPSNVRFIGTINKDETTKNLSPKVVDRSLIMEVDKYEEDVKVDILENIEEYKSKYNKVLNLSPIDFDINRVEIGTEILNILNNMKDILEKDLQVSLNNRFFRQVEEIIGANIIEEENILDYIVLTKIIPKINIYLENEDRIYRFEELIKNLPSSKEIFNKMKLQWEETEVLTFWR